MKKFNFKGRKHAVTATCLLVGMFVLTSAVYANYDDARGYTNYKEAVKDLAFYQNNFSTKGDMTISIDGKDIATINGTFNLDGKDYYMKTVSEEKLTPSGNKIESVIYYKDGKEYIYYPEANSYSEHEGSGDFRPDMDDPTIKKSIKFVELFADAMVGDLKNNFVLTSKDGDNRTYSVNVSGNQIPEVVNAGISLMFTAANDTENANPSMVTYEDHKKAFAAFYKEKTGKEMTEKIYEDSDEEMNKIQEEFYDKYNDVLESKGDVGIVYVNDDGTYEYYKTYDGYLKEAKKTSFTGDGIMKMLGTEPYIDSAACNFTLDKEGRLVSNKMEASMTGVDSNGKKHTITIKANCDMSDYGITKVEAFDTTGKTKEN